jgi:hypothetical protein
MRFAPLTTSDGEIIDVNRLGVATGSALDPTHESEQTPGGAQEIERRQQ